MPREEDEFALTYYNTMTTWITYRPPARRLRPDPRPPSATTSAVTAAIRAMAATHADLRHAQGGEEALGPRPGGRLPGHAVREALGRHDRPARTSTLRFVAVPRRRGQQLKEQAQLDGWLRDGSAAYVESLCEWA